MTVDIIPASALSHDLISQWNEIVRGATEFASPYFRPEFIQAVAAVRGNVELGVIRDGNTVAGFFPFERVSGVVARPVAGRLSDYQAVITPAELPWTVADLMRSCRLKSWEFDHHVASQRQLEPYTVKISNSWRINTAAGFEDYVAARKSAGAGALSEMLRKSRKLHRERNVRFEWEVNDETVFDQLLAWKSEQYRRSNLADLFEFPWIVALLKSIWQTRSPQFSGVLSAMYVDDKPAAIHFGMQSGSLLHSWFPAYDISLGKYSPGAALLLSIIQHSADHAIGLVDLGKGDDDYKLTFANDSVPLAEGIVETRFSATVSRRVWQLARSFVHQSGLRSLVGAPIRWLRRIRDQIALR